MLPGMVRRKKESAAHSKDDTPPGGDAKHTTKNAVPVRYANNYLVQKVYYLQHDCETLLRLVRSEYDMLTLPGYLRTEGYDKSVEEYYQALQAASDANKARDVAVRDAEDANFHAKGIDSLRQRRKELQSELYHVCYRNSEASIRKLLREVRNGIVSDKWYAYDSDVLWLVEDLCECELEIKQLKYKAEQSQHLLCQAELAYAHADAQLKWRAGRVRRSIWQSIELMSQLREEFARLLATDLEINATNLSVRATKSGVVHLYFCNKGKMAFAEGHGHSQVSIVDGCEFYRRDEGQECGIENLVEPRHPAAKR